jgi:hypothetical protein
VLGVNNQRRVSPLIVCCCGHELYLMSLSAGLAALFSYLIFRELDTGYPVDL